MKICVWQLFFWFSRLAPSHDSSISRGRRNSRSTPENATLSLFFVNKLTPPLSYFCTHEMGWRCQDIFAASPRAPLNSLWFHFIPPVSWYFALESQFFGFDLLRSMILYWLCLSLKTSRGSLVVFVKKKPERKVRREACVAPQVTLL